MQKIITERNKGRRVAIKTEGGTKTEKGHAGSTNINQIMARYRRTGLVPQKTNLAYGDFTGSDDYRDCLDRIIQAENAFNSLPSQIRKRFDNDPAKLISFLANEDNREEAQRLGLIERPIEPEPQIVEPNEAPGDLPS